MVRALLAALAMAIPMSALAADIEANKKTVLEFYEKALNQKDFEAAAQHFGRALHPAQPQRAGRPRGLQGVRRVPQGEIPQLAQRDQAGASPKATT